MDYFTIKFTMNLATIGYYIFGNPNTIWPDHNKRYCEPSKQMYLAKGELSSCRQRPNSSIDYNKTFISLSIASDVAYYIWYNKTKQTNSFGNPISLLAVGTAMWIVSSPKHGPTINWWNQDNSPRPTYYAYDTAFKYTHYQTYVKMLTPVDTVKQRIIDSLASDTNRISINQIDTLQK